MTRPVFHWFLPTGGDDRGIGAATRGGIGGVLGTGTATESRPASLGYLSQIARAADALGYDGLLTPTGLACEDAWLASAALIPHTTRLRFLVALRPGLLSPMLAAQMAASFQRLSGGRLAWNVVTGSSDAEQRGLGDPLGHDERYERAAEFLAITRAAATGERVDHDGGYYTVEGGHVRPAEPVPVYLGGSSGPALDVAARYADTYLTWGEPPAQVKEKLDRLRERTAVTGRALRVGLRVHVIARDTTSRAWADADRLIAGLDDATIADRQAGMRALTSVGQQRMLALHGGDRRNLVVAPNLWAGIGLVRGGAGTALVGSYDDVAERIAEYQALGVDEFILSGYPHLEEAYAFADGVMPLFPR